MIRHRKAINSVSNTILLRQIDKIKLKYYVKKNHSIYTDIKHLITKGFNTNHQLCLYFRANYFKSIAMRNCSGRISRKPDVFSRESIFA